MLRLVFIWRAMEMVKVKSTRNISLVPTIGSLDHLEGETVQIEDTGLQPGDEKVTPEVVKKKATRKNKK